MERRRGRIRRGLLAVMLILSLTGCGRKEECAICGAENANKTLQLEGHEISICAECYKTYIEIQQLFQER